MIRNIYHANERQHSNTREISKGGVNKKILVIIAMIFNHFSRSSQYNNSIFKNQIQMMVRKKTALFADNSGFQGYLGEITETLLHLIRVSVGQLSTQNIHISFTHTKNS